MITELETTDITPIPYGEISQRTAAFYRPENYAISHRQEQSREPITNSPYRFKVEFFLEKGWPIDSLLADLRDLLKEDKEDEYGILSPTSHALSVTILLIVEAYRRQHSEWPFGCVSTDSEGGIRIEWNSPKGEIRLVVPDSDNKKHYIYYEFGDKYDIDEQVNPGKLVWWLNQLI